MEEKLKTQIKEKEDEIKNLAEKLAKLNNKLHDVKPFELHTDLFDFCDQSWELFRSFSPERDELWPKIFDFSVPYSFSSLFEILIFEVEFWLVWYGDKSWLIL